MTYAELLAMRDKDNPKPHGFVYFVANALDTGEVFVKIGWTQNMATRFKVFIPPSAAGFGWERQASCPGTAQ